MATRLLILLLLAAAVLTAVEVYHGQVVEFGNLTVVYSVYELPAVGVELNGCVYYVVRGHDPKVVDMWSRTQRELAEFYNFTERWRREFQYGTWPIIAEELRSANYSGYLDFYYCCGPLVNKSIAERLSKSSRWVNRTVSLADAVSKTLKAAGLDVGGVYINVWQGFISVEAFTDPRRGLSQYAKVRGDLDSVFKAYKDKLLVIINIKEAPAPSPYVVGLDPESVRKKLARLKEAIFQAYREVGVDVNPIDVVTGIGAREGLYLVLIAPPNETHLLRALTERSVKELGICPNGSVVIFFKTGALKPVGVDIPWRLAALEAAAMATAISAAVYVVKKKLVKPK
ncbi:hypothetical protein [Pyrobaculum neutrophilum]|uniref:Uncharacterized protein n=1 Tax=Pyrobaculum neutrophilum (strain DSM 2338 / JCM 9278 / NBRC 100436 / V24Sta) TaxID=444157 RepID=B1YAH2_PYRNV|nr:hypothetical protein [Pyrobaculum neutrophilum]ACB40621.1 hypothetical protein Tneu_1701 [Pyrobaculum neutrophilum V24Sta]